ncbi:hypothetical protein, partial [Escherichia coli]|uniref:hypothetical protein n=1 Tax=Escherichia coli TaxID=562 RepID=UPI001BAF4FA6
KKKKKPPHPSCKKKEVKKDTSWSAGVHWGGKEVVGQPPLCAGVGEVDVFSRCLGVCGGQLQVILRRTYDWKYRGKSTSLLFRKDFSGSKQRSMPD